VKVMTTIQKAVDLANTLAEQNYRARVLTTPYTGHVLLALRTTHFTEKHRNLIAEIQRICGVPFTKNRTATNRTSYIAKKDGFTITCPTNIPICKNSTFCREPKQSFKTFWQCPIGEEEVNE